MEWYGISEVASASFVCGFCDSLVGSAKGWKSSAEDVIRICTHCDKPSYFGRKSRFPGAAAGEKVYSLPEPIDDLYEEARRCIQASCPTAAVLICRKVLMHVAVVEGAKSGLSFIAYVEYLAQHNYIPPKARGWVDHIRTKGNEANHEIIQMSDIDARQLITFTGMLLKLVYEFPNRLPQVDDGTTGES